MRILVISGSARRESLNTRLAQVASAARPGDTVTLMSGLDRMPFYSADVEEAGLPAPVLELREVVADADALVIVTPEYNGTVPGMLVNAVDWLSRPPGDSVLQRKPVVVLSASPSRYGGIRAAEHLRTVRSTPRWPRRWPACSRRPWTEKRRRCPKPCLRQPDISV